MTQRRPALLDYVYFDHYCPRLTRREGFVTELLSAQFVARESLDGPPMFVFYSDSWQTYAEQSKRP